MRRKIVLRLACAIVMASILATGSTGCKKEEKEEDFIFSVVDKTTGLQGYMDVKGNLVIGAAYNKAGEFQNDRAVVTEYQKQDNGMITGKSGVIDRSGNIAAPIQYDELKLSTDGGLIRFTVNSKDEANPYGIVSRYGYLDKDGKEVIAPLYENALPFEDGVAVVKKDGQYQLINEKGETVRTYQGVTIIAGYNEGLFGYSTSEVYNEINIRGNWGFMDKDGNIIVNETNRSATAFDNGVAIVENYVDGAPVSAFVNKRGETIATLAGVVFSLPLKDGIAAGGLFDKGWGAANNKGEWIVEPKYRQIWIGDGVVLAKEVDNEYIYFDAQGKKMFTCSDLCTPFYQGYAFYIRDGRIYMMDKEGETVLAVPVQYVPNLAIDIWMESQSI